MLLGRTAVELEIGDGTGTSGLEDTGVLNTANGQTAGLDRVVVGVLKMDMWLVLLLLLLLPLLKLYGL